MAKQVTKAFKVDDKLADQINAFCDTNDISFNQLANDVFKNYLHQNEYFDAHLKDIDAHLKIIKSNLQDIAENNLGHIQERHHKLYEFVTTTHDLIRTLPQWKEPHLLKDVFYKPKK